MGPREGGWRNNNGCVLRSCAFGHTCKFHHPEAQGMPAAPTTAGARGEHAAPPAMAPFGRGTVVPAPMQLLPPRPPPLGKSSSSGSVRQVQQGGAGGRQQGGASGAAAAARREAGLVPTAAAAQAASRAGESYPGAASGPASPPASVLSAAIAAAQLGSLPGPPARLVAGVTTTPHPHHQLPLEQQVPNASSTIVPIMVFGGQQSSTPTFAPVVVEARGMPSPPKASLQLGSARDDSASQTYSHHEGDGGMEGEEEEEEEGRKEDQDVVAAAPAAAGGPPPASQHSA